MVGNGARNGADPHWRMTVEVPPGTVVFFIGMRVNSWWKVHKWVPVALAMPRMLRELERNPAMGLKGLRNLLWSGREFITVQYWESVDALMDYARNPDAEHWPAWAEFYKKVGDSGDVGIWHETYVIGENSYEAIYGNMPVVGLGAVGQRFPADGSRREARQRLSGAG